MSTQETVTADKAKAVLAAEAERRKKECAGEIEASCARHGCKLVAQVVIRDAQVSAQVIVEAG